MSRLQTGAIVISVGAAGFVLHGAADRVPQARWWATTMVLACFNLWWIGSILWLRWTRRVAEDSPKGWFRHNLWVFWLGNASTVAAFWLLMPYAGDAELVLAVLFTTAPVAIEAMGSVRPPGHGRRDPLLTWAPVGIPAGTMAYMLVHGGPMALPVLFFWPTSLAVWLLLREFLHQALVETHVARLAAVRAGDARTRFLAAASHDLGQPLQSARLFLDQAVRTAEPAKRQRALDHARDALSAMERLVVQMLDHLRLDAGAVRPRPRSIIASQPIAHVAAQFEPVAALAGVQLIPVPSSAALSADPDLLVRALGNLVDNALRHGRARRIVIGVRRCGDSLRFYVLDDGVGVAAADRERLFDDYVQGGDAGGGERGGFGLGLASVRRIAGLMGGRACLDPGWRNGAAFFIELPLGGAEDVPA